MAARDASDVTPEAENGRMITNGAPWSTWLAFAAETIVGAAVWGEITQQSQRLASLNATG